MQVPHRCAVLLSVTFLLLAGCRTAVPAYESQAANQLGKSTAGFRTSGEKPALPTLRAESTLSEYIYFAVLNHPEVEAAFDDWRASIAAITPARSLPDPKFTFEADIADTLMTFMPGLMFDFMTPGKRAAMGREAAAGAEVAHRDFINAVLRTATATQKAWIELAYVEESRRLYAETIHAVEDAVAFTNTDYATGRGMASLEKQTQLLNEAARHHMHHAALDDQLAAARTRFKAALGLSPTDANPPWPSPKLVPSTLPSYDELWQRAANANPDLGRMRAMVEMAIANVAVARTGGTPDFALGAMADFKANPLMVRPTASVSLPIWRDKIAANIAAAEARRDSASARVKAEQLNVAAELARMLYMAREADRMLTFIDRTAIPNLARSLSTLEAAVQSGMSSPAMLAETRMMELDLRHEKLDALRDRENAVAELLLLTADSAPADPFHAPATN
jgi:outer membrane protein TolC